MTLLEAISPTARMILEGAAASRLPAGDTADCQSALRRNGVNPPPVFMSAPCISTALVDRKAVIHVLQGNGRTLCGLLLGSGQEEIGPASCERCLQIQNKLTTEAQRTQRREEIYDADF